MKILHERPPFYDKVVAVFPEVDNMKHVLFTYGDTIYNPAGGDIPPYTIHHEGIHMHQQQTIGKDTWWDIFLKDTKFRFDQEIEAYRKEYKVFCSMYKDRNERDSFLRFQAEMLSSPMYGNLVTINEARARITT